ncbi:sodium/hydrogen exchanger 10 [Tachyglossus aculeatus]|uniref:sodium/hydrogen exchanger 10 n=1 Tax=Tachyglossus aculeatus TaxID=9261 RepID=UPI0018F3018A|nr:sodium/hydrogen exchanger 10 [Tachyglossus aculeatus]
MDFFSRENLSNSFPLQVNGKMASAPWQNYLIQLFSMKPKHIPQIIPLVCIITLFGGLLRTRLKDLRILIPLVLFLLGCGLELLSYSSYEVQKYTDIIEWMSPFLYINLFTPAIIFSVAFEMEFYMFQKLFWQIILLSIPGIFLNYFLINWYLSTMNKYKMKRITRSLVSLILGAIDPSLSATCIKDLGLSKGLINLIKGECLLTAACTVINFNLNLQIYNQLQAKPFSTLGKQIYEIPLKKYVLSCIFGYFSSKVFLLWLVNTFGDDITEAALSFSSVYIIFYLAEWSGMSGILSLAVLGLFLNSTSFRPGAELFLFKFWKCITFFAIVMEFTLIGILVPAHSYVTLSVDDIYYAVQLYFTLIVLRIMVLLVLNPFLSYLGNGFNWRWAITLVWSEMRGLPNINMALLFSYNMNTMSSERIRAKVLLQVVMLCLITLIVNSFTLPWVVTQLGLRDVTLTKRKSLYYTVQHFQEIITTTASTLKFDKDLANADWNLVEESIVFKNPYQFSPEESPEPLKIKCPDCNKELGEGIANPEAMELARVRLLSAQIASYKRQYTNQILSQDAVQVLVGAAASFCDKKGEYMNLQAIRTYSESKKLLHLLRKLLLNWVYNTKKEKGIPSRNQILFLCHKIVFTDEFEYTGYLAIMLNLAPIIISWLPVLSKIYQEETTRANHSFLIFYIVEAILKIAAMRSGYFLHAWNLFELTITLGGIIDVLLTDFKGDKYTYDMSQVVVSFKIIRFLRVLRILKLITPKMLRVLDKRLSDQLSFRYAILKGYVQGEADITCIIDQIAGRKSVARLLHKLVSKNAKQALKELGYLEYDHPDIAITMKTKQEINAILHLALEILRNLQLRGIISKAESSGMYKMILFKRKAVLDFPSVIQAPSVKEMLSHVTWLDKNEVHINFIQEKVKILTFDCGNYIFEEGDRPQGIYLIISGMVKLQSSRPNLENVSKLFETEEEGKITYTDYQISGSIIGELSCLTQEPMKYSAICKTVVETCFISISHLHEAFEKCCPALEYKMWLKLALSVGTKKVKECLAYQDWTYKMHLQLSNVYVKSVPMGIKTDIYDETMEHVVLIHGSVEDCQLRKLYFAPFLIPKTCHQVQGTSKITKLLVMQTSVNVKKCMRNIAKYVPVCKHITRTSAGSFSRSLERRRESEVHLNIGKVK